MDATLENMRKYSDQPGLVAVDPETGDRYSANHGDYWWLPEGEPLTNPNGTPLVLATVHTTVKPVLPFD